MSQYHYDLDEIEAELAEDNAKKEKLRIKKIEKQESCKHLNCDPPSEMGFGYCWDCGAIL